MGKPDFCICENKDADQLRSNREADQCLCFRYIVQFLYFLNPKFQFLCHFPSLYSPVCVGPCRNSRRQVFSRRMTCNVTKLTKLLHHISLCIHQVCSKSALLARGSLGFVSILKIRVFSGCTRRLVRFVTEVLFTPKISG